MATPLWNFKLRLLKRNPDSITMDRLAEYMREFAELLGVENSPVFKGIKRASTALLARVPADRLERTTSRMVDAIIDPASKPGKSISHIESMLITDGIPGAELRDSADNVIYLFESGPRPAEDTFRVYEAGIVDGTVTGAKGADDTVSMYLRDMLGRDLTLIARDVDISRALLHRFREGLVRVYVHGTWVRTHEGWQPEASKCTIDHFEILDESTPSVVFAELNTIKSNGWLELVDPIAAWRDLRGASQ